MSDNKNNSFNQTEYSIEYAKKHYKRVPLDLSINKYNQLKDICSSLDMPINTFIKSAIDEKIERT